MKHQSTTADRFCRMPFLIGSELFDEFSLIRRPANVRLIIDSNVQTEGQFMYTLPERYYPNDFITQNYDDVF